MNGFDHFIKDELGIEYYGRYVDDFIIVHQDKAYLKRVMKISKEWLSKNLGMAHKDDMDYYKMCLRECAYLFYCMAHFCEQNLELCSVLTSLLSINLLLNQ